MTAVAVEPGLAFERRLGAVPREAAGSSFETASLLEAVSGGKSDIKLWELHSELVLVCPEVSERARDLMPERDPDAVLFRFPEPASPQATGADAVAIAANLPVAVVAYALWRLAETARTTLIALAAVVALALLAEVLH
jgi:hypothetical protein